MDKYISFLFLVLNIVNIASALPAFTEGYYWKDFEGTIPADAFRAGYDESGRTMYIGQVLVNNMLIPGKIYLNDNNIYYEWEEQAWSTDKNIRILCTQEPENFKWIPTTGGKASQLKKELLVKGGYQPEFLTYIGRVRLSGKTNIGKIICRETDCLAMYATEEGVPAEYHKFDILSYKTINLNKFEIIEDEQYYVYTTS